MNCPACGAPVVAGTSICPICDFIIDASFLDAAGKPAVADVSDRTLPRARMPGLARDVEGTAIQPVTELEGTALRPAPAMPSEGTALRPAAALGRAPTASRRGPPPAVGKTSTSGGIARTSTAAARAALPAAVADAHTTIGVSPAPPSRASAAIGATPSRRGVKAQTRAVLDADSDSADADAGAGDASPRGRSMPEAPGRQISAPRGKVDYAALAQEYGDPAVAPKATFKPERMTSPDEAFDEFRQFFGGLSLSDKLTMVGAFLVVISTFLPWKTTAAEGEVLGVLCLGGVATALGIAAIAAVRVRVSGLASGRNPVLPWVGQLGAVSAALVWCLVFIRISWDGTLARAVDGNIQVATSKPDAGVYIALVSAIVAVAGTLGGLRDHGEPPR